MFIITVVIIVITAVITIFISITAITIVIAITAIITIVIITRYELAISPKHGALCSAARLK